MKRLYEHIAGRVICRLLPALCLAVVAAGCDVHEFPELPQEAAFTLRLDFDTELPLHKEVQYAVRSAGAANAYDVRHIVSVHRLAADGSYVRQADRLFVFTCDDEAGLNCSQELTLAEGKYNFFVWTDYVHEGTTADNYYATPDFAEIILTSRTDHAGCEEYRDAFRGSQQAAVTVRKDGMREASNVATVTMKRPMAKFKFVSTDYGQFVEEALKARAGTEGTESTDGTESGTRVVDPADYRVVFRYTGFMPCSYNMFTDRPADSWTGVSFEGGLKTLGNDEVELGFDYVFVNGSEAGVSVAVEVYHKDGELVASSPTINVPLVRSKLTVVKGSFLTSVAEGGVGIDPDFDDEYNIEIK